MKLLLALSAITFYWIIKFSYKVVKIINDWRGKKKDEYDPQKDFI